MFFKSVKQFGDTNFPKFFNCFNHINIVANISWLLSPHCRTCAWCITSNDPGHQNQRHYLYLTSRSALCCLRWKTWIQKLLLEQVYILHCKSHIDFSIIPHKQGCRRVKHRQDKLSQFAAGFNKWNVRRVRLKYQPSWLLGQAFKSQKTEILSRDIKLDNFPVHT